jgi:competence protein ComFC
MTIREFMYYALRKLRHLFIVRVCIICKDPISYDIETPICEDCLDAWYKHLDSNCIKCGQPRDFCSCLPNEIKRNFPFAVWSVFYNGENERFCPDNILRDLKHDQNRDIISFCARMMKTELLARCKAHGVDYRDFVVTYAPRSKRNINEHGFDQSRVLAKRLARILNLKFVPSLRNIGKKEQKKLKKAERLENALKSYRISKKFVCEDKKYFLVDDVLTSGATAFSCARLLIDHGATTVIPVFYAKDNIDSSKKEKKKC